MQAPDGAIWKFATSSKKDTGPAGQEYDHLVLLLGVDDVKATKQFYVDHGLEVGKSFGSKYVEFEVLGAGHPAVALHAAARPRRTPGSTPRAPARTGSLSVSDAGAFTDPDGFAWEPATADRIG